MAFLGGLLAVSLASLFAAEGPPLAPDWIPRLISAEEAAEGFYPLYNGSDLDGWTVKGANKRFFCAQGDVLAVTGTGGGEWLVSMEQYESFVLRYGFRMRDKTDASLVGYGIDADGPIAEQVLAPTVCPDRPLMEWNEVEVVCSGGQVQMSVNGIPQGDAPARPGHIGIKNCGRCMQFRGIRIKPLPGGSGWRRWEGRGENPLPESFELRFRFKPSADSRGAIVVASKKNKPLFEVRIDNHAPDEFTGSIAGKAGALELRALDDCWNHMRIAMDGPNVQVRVNGKTVVDFVSTRRASCAGAEIRFNVEQGSIEFEDIEIGPKEQLHGN
jgi:hypothetical protein